MDAADFAVWIRDLSVKFPAIREWLRSIEPIEDHHALIDAWQASLAKPLLDDCLAVNRAMLAGELDGPGEWPAQWQSLPGRIRRHSEALGRRRDLENSERLHRDSREHLRTVLIRSRRKAGVPLEQINAELARAGFERVAMVKNANADNPT